MKIFITLFLGTVRPTKLKLRTHMDDDWNQAAAAYSSHYFFIFLSLQVSKIKIFFTLLSGTVRPTRLKVDTHVDSGWMYCVYWNRAADYFTFISSFLFLSNFQRLKFFVTLFSGTVMPTKLKLGIHMNCGWM